MNMLQTLDRLMKEKGLNRSRLAQKSGVPYTTIDGLYKKGFENVKLSTLLKLSRTLGVTLDELAGEEAPLGKERLDHEDLAVARDYHALDGHGKRLVRLVLDEEKSRLGTSAEEEPQEYAEEPQEYYEEAPQEYTEEEPQEYEEQPQEYYEEETQEYYEEAPQEYEEEPQPEEEPQAPAAPVDPMAAAIEKIRQRSKHLSEPNVMSDEAIGKIKFFDDED